MKLLIEKIDNNFDNIKTDGLILSLKDYSVQSIKYFSIEEIKDISNKYNIDIYLKINKNIFNKDIDKLKEVLLELDKLKIKGIFFYDLSLLKLKKDLNLKTDLILDMTHMTTNSSNCNYFYNKGVKYALLSKELTIDEINETSKNTNINIMIELISRNTIAFSKRKLLTSYNKINNYKNNNKLEIKEKVTKRDYIVTESDNGTSFYNKEITNGLPFIDKLKNIKYIIIREYGIDNFKELTNDIYNHLHNNKELDFNKYNLGNYYGFFEEESYYKVKDNE